MKCQGFILDELAEARDKLYEGLPSGDIDAFEIIKLIKKHLKDLDTIHEYYSKVHKDIQNGA